MQTSTIASDEQEGCLSSFWTMLRECEQQAYENDCPLLKRWVEQWYEQWNRMTDDTKCPCWVRNSSTNIIGSTK